MVYFHPSLEPLLVDIDTVKQHPQNARNGDVDVIVESIEASGFVAPVVVQRSSGFILAGNHRYLALKALGETRIPVVEVEMTDEGALRYLLGDNKASDNAVYDQGQLADLLRVLSETEIGLTGTGFSSYELEVLLAENATPGEFSKGMIGFTQTLMLAFPADIYTQVCDRLDAHAHQMGTKDRARALADMLGVTDD